jgi:hypothetical protein
MTQPYDDDIAHDTGHDGQDEPGGDDARNGEVAHQPESLGDPRVDEAVDRLDDLSQRPVGDHVAVFDDIHNRLRGALEDAAVDQPG